MGASCPIFPRGILERNVSSRERAVTAEELALKPRSRLSEHRPQVTPGQEDLTWSPWREFRLRMNVLHWPARKYRRRFFPGSCCGRTVDCSLAEVLAKR